MKYVSVDLETTGIDQDKDQIIEFAAIVEDTKNPLSFDEIPKFHCFVVHERYSGTPFALSLNQRIFKQLSKVHDMYQNHIKHKLSKNFYVEKDGFIFCNEFSLASLFVNFINSNKIDPFNINGAGKNFASFDLQFIKKLTDYGDYFKFNRRSLDPANMFIDFDDDECLPNTEICKKRAGIKNTEVSHLALEDAWDVIKLLRKKY